MFLGGNKLEFDYKKEYKDVFVTIKLSADINKILTESSARSHRKKLQEAKIRLEDHLMRFKAISEKGMTVCNEKKIDKSFFISK